MAVPGQETAAPPVWLIQTFMRSARSRILVALLAAAIGGSLWTACGNGTPAVTVSTTPDPFFIANDCSYVADTTYASGLTEVCTGAIPITIEGVPFAMGLQTDALAVSPSIPVQAKDIKTPITYFVSNGSSLPPGLSLDSQTGVISGIPNQAGTFSFSVYAVDSTSPTPNTSASATFTLTVAAPTASLTSVGQNDLGGIGQNAGITVFNDYAYIGNRGVPGSCPANSFKVVNLSDPTNPQVVATIPNPSGASYQPVGQVAAVNTPSFQGDLLAVAIAPCDPATDTSAGDTGVALYNVSNPASPIFLGSWSARATGGAHGVSSVAVLPESNAAYVLAAVPEAEHSGSGYGDLQVLNVTNPAAPAMVANWGIGKALGIDLKNVAVGQDQRVFLDTISLSADGTQAYLAYWDEGVVILNVSDPTAISDTNSGIVLSHTVYPTIYAASSTILYSAPEGNTHQAIPVDNGAGMLISDLVCASQKIPDASGSGSTSLNPYTTSVCGTDVDLTPSTGWGFVRTYTLAPVTAPQPAGGTALSTTESDPAPAAGTIFPGDGIYSAHDIAWNGNAQNPRGYVAWFSNGLVDLDLQSLSTPSVLAAFVPPATADPQGSTPGVNNPDAPLVYGVAPFTENGNQYIAITDINSGLWVVQEAGASQFAMTTTSLPNGTVDAPYSATFNSINGVGLVSYSLVGTAPAGLTLTNGVLSGTPTTAGSSTFAVEAADSAGNIVSQQYTVTINSNLVITTDSLPEATTNEAYSQTFTAVNGDTPYSWSVTGGSLPAGMSLSSAGVLSGTPTAAGTSNFTVTVTGVNKGLTDSAAFTLTTAPLTISTTSLPNAGVGVAYSQTITMANGAPSFTFTVSKGSLPAGVTMSSDGVMSGTPTTAGISNFTIHVTDGDGQTATQALSITVGGITISPTSLPNGAVGTGYFQALTITNGVSPYTFALASGSGPLPPGLTLSAENSSGVPGAANGTVGVISGVPTTAGTYTFTVKVTDKNGVTAKQPYTVVIP
ncbi:MAG: putative Ig domain-containing protein [Terriglobales bacterium]